jgi:glycine C-acetyltransferase
VNLGKLDFLKEELQELKDSGLYGTMRAVNSPVGAWLVVDGVEVLNMCSNNYLGLANSPKLKDRVRENLDRFGIGAAGARLISGTNTLHVQFEQTLARFKKTEAVLMFSSGWDANIGTIQGVTGKGDLIISDELNHGSLIDACRLSRAERVVYPHKDINGLRDALVKGKDARRRLILTDGVFSMDGDLAPLPEIVELADEYNAIIMVDDAHGEGVLGDHGRGIVDHFGLHGRVDIEMGTMSKAFSVIGGYIAGSKDLIDYLLQRARSSFLASAPTLIDVSACIAAVETLEESDELVKRLWDNTRYFKDGMRSLGFDIGHSETPIVPVMLGDAKLAQDFEKRLFDNKILAHAISYPTVARGQDRLRLMLSAAHKRQDLDFALGALEKIGRENGVLS